jgi:hypothetical protein
VEESKALHLAQTIGCQVASMPFTYLGLPLRTSKPSVDEFFPLANKVERRMMGISKMFSYQGRLILVNSVLSALLTFFMCALKIPIIILDQVDKYRKHLLFDRGDVNRKGGCLVAWKKATRPKK